MLKKALVKLGWTAIIISLILTIYSWSVLTFEVALTEGELSPGHEGMSNPSDSVVNLFLLLFLISIILFIFGIAFVDYGRKIGTKVGIPPWVGVMMMVGITGYLFVLIPLQVSCMCGYLEINRVSAITYFIIDMLLRSSAVGLIMRAYRTPKSQS